MNFKSSFKLKLIYVFRIPDAAHKGCLKVGETTFKDSANPLDLRPNCSELNKAAKERINQYTATAGIHYDLLHTELTLSIKDGDLWSFNDGEVHKVLTRSGIKRVNFGTEQKAN
ncbi:MAG: DEAD/DEAH box helicase, partial [Bacteroidaceae bacterium]|nr:DEAD/DEAH box helicase [Bacteroidaceae bacterium]